MAINMRADDSQCYRDFVLAGNAVERFVKKRKESEVSTLSMKQAKPTEQEFDRLGEFLQDLELHVSDSAMQDAEFRAWVRSRMRAVSSSVNRVLWGGRTAIENACDPDADTLEWKPEIAAALKAAEEAKPTIGEG